MRIFAELGQSTFLDQLPEDKEVHNNEGELLDPLSEGYRFNLEQRRITEAKIQEKKIQYHVSESILEESNTVLKSIMVQFHEMYARFKRANCTIIEHMSHGIAP
ncbi:hypothetical protein FNV43_RR22878 [Rhamnella rubrinervis]|uniref:Uncharacterized protein n=1 Tax=Rhamnella rubrinervis TaxID=2594499 RepID=A0A8K0DSB8_9ROSA|nr:hypothetical protein FNV43_RR22878 [Rhamnella rubrinervis]